MSTIVFDKTNTAFPGQIVGTEARCKCGGVDTKYDTCGKPGSEEWCKDNGSTYCPIGIPQNKLKKGQFCCEHDQCQAKLSCENDANNKGFKTCQKATLTEGDTCEHKKQCTGLIGKVDCPSATLKCTADDKSLGESAKCSSSLQCIVKFWCGKKSAGEEFTSCHKPWLEEGQTCGDDLQCIGDSQCLSGKCFANYDTVRFKEKCSIDEQCSTKGHWCGKYYKNHKDTICIPQVNEDEQYCRTSADCKNSDETPCPFNKCKPNPNSVKTGDLCSNDGQCKQGFCWKKDITKPEKRCNKPKSMVEGQGCLKPEHCANDADCPIDVCVAKDNTLPMNQPCSKDTQCKQIDGQPKTMCIPALNKIEDLRCKPLSKEKHACLIKEHCGYEFAACNDNICSWEKGSRELEQSCQANDQCKGNNMHVAGSNVCIGTKCKPISSKDGTCGDSNDCVGPLMCHKARNKCVDPVPLEDGSECVADKECISNHCVDKTCVVQAMASPAAAAAGTLPPSEY